VQPPAAVAGAQPPAAVAVLQHTVASSGAREHIQTPAAVAGAQPPAALAGAQPPAALADVQPPLCAAAVPDYRVLVASFPQVLNASKVLPAVKHHVRHAITTSSNANAAHYHHLDSEKLQAAKTEFELLEKQGIVRRSKSYWASPLHMVHKANST